MTSQELLDYVRGQLNLSYSPEQIKPILVRRGWKEDEINEAFNSVRQAQPAGTPPAPPGEKPPQETLPKEPRKGRSKKKIIILIIAILIIACLLFFYGDLILATVTGVLV
jgi:hypothetical protein